MHTYHTQRETGKKENERKIMRERGGKKWDLPGRKEWVTGYRAH